MNMRVLGNWPELKEAFEKADYKTRLAVTAWVMENILDHANEGGSYRYLIYDRLGFDVDSYAVLFDAGGLEISNEFDIDKNNNIKKLVREHKIEVLKPPLGLCDEPGCFADGSCGTPTPEKYRLTCFKHMPKEKEKGG